MNPGGFQRVLSLPLAAPIVPDIDVCPAMPYLYSVFSASFNTTTSQNQSRGPNTVRTHGSPQAELPRATPSSLQEPTGDPLTHWTLPV